MVTSNDKGDRPETLKEILERTRRELPYLKRRYGVERLAVFGSFAKGRARKRSDLDILVQLRRLLGFDFVNLADHLDQVLGGKVDPSTFEMIERSKEAPHYKHVAQDIEQTLVYVEAQGRGGPIGIGEQGKAIQTGRHSFTGRHV